MQIPLPGPLLRFLLLRDGDHFLPREKTYLALSLLVHLVAAWISVGYHHHDEHFQIVEFAGLMLGTTPASGLPWEYSSQLRPWMQPIMLVLFAKPLMWLGVDSPFVLATSFRVVSALLGWVCGVYLARACLVWFKKGEERTFAIAAATLAGFLPYLHARTSSENWSASAFWIGMVLLVVLSGDRRRAGSWRSDDDGDAPSVAAVNGTIYASPRLTLFASTGLLWGMAFEFRFQAAILVVGGAAWWMCFHRTMRAESIAFTGAFAIAIGLGALCDRIGYGAWVFPAIKYFITNLIDGKAAEFGTAPWYGYFSRIVEQGAPPLGALVAIGAFATWLLKPKWSLTWCTVPYFVVHALLAHKELRFLFPIAIVAPIQAAVLWFRLRNTLGDGARAMLRGMARWIARPINAGMLVVLPLLATRSEVLMDRFIYERRPDRIVGLGRSPYDAPPLPIFFYRADGVLYERLGCNELRQRVRAAGAQSPTWVYSDSTEQLLACDATLDRCEHAYTTLPDIGGERARQFLRRAKVPDFRMLRCRGGEPR